MKIIDLTEKYKSAILEQNNLQEYEASFPELFDHYFHYWADRTKFFQALNNKEVDIRLDLIQGRLQQIEDRIRDFGLNTEQLQLVLFVGQNCTNGHAFKYRNEFVVWIPIEAYETTKQADIFVTHEIIHALHYARTSEFYFSTAEEKYSVARQVITEGLATYLTQKIVNVDALTALWADYLTASEAEGWLHKCIDKESELFGFTAENFYSQNKAFFEANDITDINTYRAGYYAGLKVIEGILRDHDLSEKSLLSLSRDEFEKKTLDILRQG